MDHIGEQDTAARKKGLRASSCIMEQQPPAA
jgi:hypothetical protein